MLGMLETIRIRREGYAFRPKFEEFVARFKLLAYGATAKVEAGPLSVQKILNSANIKGFLIGYGYFRCKHDFMMSFFA